MSGKYDADSIKLPSDMEHIFMRPGMYIGEEDTPKHLFVEAVDNAIDEAMNGYSNLTEVSYDTKKNEISVTDHGRGIPHGYKVIKNSSGKVIDKMSVIEALMTKNNSGGKFDNESFKIRGGLHGLGMKIINALSDHVWVQSRRDNEAVTYESHKHGHRIGDVKTEKMDTSKNHGTTIKFIPTEDDKFESTRIPRNFIISKCEIDNTFGYNIELVIDGKKIDLGTGKLEHLLPKSSGTTYDQKEFSIELPDGESARTLLSYTSDTKNEYKAYTNLIYNSAGGTHVYAYQKAVVDAWKPFIGDKFIKPYDVLLGSKSIIAVFIEDPDFSSQTKERLSVPKKKLAPLFDKLSKTIYKYLSTHEKLREALLKRFEEYRMSQSKLQSQKEIDDLIVINDPKKNDGTIHRKSVIPKLKECTSRSRKNTELIITEGNSACGSVTATRDVKTQAVFPVRGKVLNVAKNLNLLDNMKNEEVRGIVNSIGAGIGEKTDYTKSRYERVIISCFTGDTRVKLLDGTSPTFKELAQQELKNPNQIYWTYSIDTNNHNKLVPGKGMNPRITGHVDKLAKVTLNDGSSVKCTLDHKFLTKDYGYVEAKDLKSKMSLVPLCHHVNERTRDGNYKVVADPPTQKWVSSVEIIDLDKSIPVYCLTVEKYHNFAVGYDNPARTTKGGDNLHHSLNDNNSYTFVHNCDA